MKKKLGYVVFVVGLLLIGFGVLVVGLSNHSDQTTYGVSEEEVYNYMEELTNTIIFGGSREKLVEMLYSDEILDTDLMSGPDMYLRQVPSKSTLEGEDVSDYQKAGEIYASNLEKKIQDNFEYTVEGVSDGGNYWAALLKYRSYYYKAYLNDLVQIQVYFLEQAGYQMDGSYVKTTNKLKVDSYKALIKAAAVLDSHLDEYVNLNEFAQTYINFEHKNPEDSSDAFLSYLMNLVGYSYDFQGYIQSSNQVQEYLVGITLDSNDPLAL